ncbi:hypothetical protein JTB14_030793 [Gonioctena quinquepunctata]|nr:hypothetical protein JTB14_030793 [Gonioctena quinquepunctata]
MLFDVRLLDKKLFYLWKRIINVLFIKEHSGGGSPGKDLGWFELMTVPFPAPINGILIPWRVDIWTRSKFRKGVELFRDKTSDLQNQTLSVVVFSHLPGITKTNASSPYEVRALLTKNEDNGTTIFKGIEVEILQTISRAMNFHCDVYEPENAELELWGRKSSGGVYTGVIGEMVSARADIALGDLYYTSYILDLMDLSVPYNTECLTFLTPESLTDNSWKTLILPFSPIMWAGVLICLAFCMLSFHYLARFHEHITRIEHPTEHINKKLKKKEVLTLSIYPNPDKLDANEKFAQMKENYQQPKEEGQPVGLYQFSEPMNSVLYTYSMLLLVSIPKLPTGWSLRVLTGWHWLYCLLVVTSYRASMTAILARPAPKVKIDTLQELVASKLTCGGWGEINREFFKLSNDPVVQKISENFVLVNDSEEAVDKVADAVFAFYENTYFLKDALVKRQQRWQFQKDGNSSDNGGQKGYFREDRRLHIMNDCIISMPVSIGLQKNSPIKPRVDKYIRRVLEAGFIKKWLDDVMLKVLNAEIQTEDAGNMKALMNMKKFSGALVALFIGYFISSAALIAEVLYFNCVVVKSPRFNKYSRRIENVDNELEQIDRNVSHGIRAKLSTAIGLLWNSKYQKNTRTNISRNDSSNKILTRYED